MAVVVSEPNQAIGSEFDVGIDVTAAGTAYAAYQYKLQWDPAVLAYSSEIDLQPAGLNNCSLPNVRPNTVFAGCAASATITFTGPVSTVTLRCVAAGTSTLHLITLDEDASFGTATMDDGGAFIGTDLADASVTCGGEGPAATFTPATGPSPTPGEGPTSTATPGGPAPTPAVPGATPTPLPPGFEAVDLAAGCNPVATTYADATPIGTIAAAVGPAGNLEALWELGGTAWQGYSPAYAEASDLTASNLLDVVFVCVTGPGAFVRPIV